MLPGPGFPVKKSASSCVQHAVPGNAEIGGLSRAALRAANDELLLTLNPEMRRIVCSVGEYGHQGSSRPPGSIKIRIAFGPVAAG